MELRPYRSEDQAALIEICRLTGDAGKDATGRYRDPGLLAEYFATPYAVYAPELCRVLEDEAGACGYVIGVADTRGFVDWFNREWLPGLQAAIANVRVPDDAPDAWLYAMIRRPMEVPAWVDEYPAHVHIDLLPRAQGQGWGRRMMHAWINLARQRGATGVHLGVSPNNTGAIAFYTRLGMKRLPAPDGAVAFGIAL